MSKGSGGSLLYVAAAASFTIAGAAAVYWWYNRGEMDDGDAIIEDMSGTCVPEQTKAPSLDSNSKEVVIRSRGVSLELEKIVEEPHEREIARESEQQEENSFLPNEHQRIVPIRTRVLISGDIAHGQQEATEEASNNATVVSLLPPETNKKQPLGSGDCPSVATAETSMTEDDEASESPSVPPQRPARRRIFAARVAQKYWG